MSLDVTFIPKKPFDEFKWQWASVQCTEGLNDPVVLLGVLSKMRKLEGKYKYSSKEFTDELSQLEADISDSVSVNLASRTGERNLIRNSGQYWKALGLIDDNSRGNITLTDFGRDVADKKISQAEFAAITTKTLVLPNRHVQNTYTCKKWDDNNISIKPLTLILDIIKTLYQANNNEGYLTTNELCKIVIPLSAMGISNNDYVNFVLWGRDGSLDLSMWPDCCLGANDQRMAREFFLFLEHYGYLIATNPSSKRFDARYYLNRAISDELSEIISMPTSSAQMDVLKDIRKQEIVSDIERKRVLSYRTERPNQAKFRKSILNCFNNKCIITGVAMPEVLEAAHIKPVQYNGNDSIGNGLCMRIDIHQLFDTGHLRIDTDGNVFMTERAESEYSNTIPKRILIPDFVNIDFIRWRWDNYNGI